MIEPYGKSHFMSRIRKLFNLNNNREIKKTVKGSTPGYWLGRRFYSLPELRGILELIPKKEKLPF